VLFGLLIDEHGVSLREGAAPAVLAGHPDMSPLGAQRGDRQRLGGRPIDIPAGFDRGTLGFELAGYFRIEMKSLWEGDEPVSHILQYLDRDAGVTTAVITGRLVEPGPGPFEPVLPVRAIALSRLKLCFEAGDKAGSDRPNPGFVDDPRRNDAVGVDLPCRRMTGDRAVHQRLGEGRLVALVVPVPAIAEQVDDDVLFELLTVFRGDAGDFYDGLGIIAVNVKDRRLDPLCYIRGIRARSRGRRARRKADLVVDDDVDRAAGAKAGELRQFERFGDETLAGEGRIAMH
jgi:hypothetical protein